MNGVLLRCPVCGTTQSQPGECDACAEGTVRYFCGNHSPGEWLDGPLCSDCGARFGEAPRKGPDLTPHAAPTKPLHETRRPGPAPSVSGGTGPRRTVRRSPPAAGRPVDTPAVPSLRDLLADLSEGRESPGYTVEEVPRVEPTMPVPGRSPFVLGCLFRLLLMVVVLIVLAVFGFFLLLGGVLQ